MGGSGSLLVPSAPRQRAALWPLRAILLLRIFNPGVLQGQLPNSRLQLDTQWSSSHAACLLCSALAVLASGSGVSTERESFMGLVKNEIDRLNEDMGGRGSVSMVFHAGGVKVGCLAGIICSALPGCAGLHRSSQAVDFHMIDCCD